MTSQKSLSLAGKAFFGSLCAGTFGLGVWQTQRYFEKQDLIQQRATDLAAPPTENILEQQQQNGSFRRLQLQGRYLHSAEILVGPRGPPPGTLPDKPGSSAQGMSSAPQGYFVLTPFIPSSPEIRKSMPMVMVNRGWVPRHLVVPDRRQAASTSSSSSSLLQWNRPEPTKNNHVQQVIVVPSQEEKPRFLVAEHKMNERPPQLFWYDLETMQRWIGWKEATTQPLRLYTAVAAADTQQQPQPTWPAAPPAHAVGTFKVEPAVHAGYALTWYGLSAAGLYMTRKMVTRGR